MSVVKILVRKLKGKIFFFIKIIGKYIKKTYK